MAQLSNQRNPVFEIALASMILAQFLLLAMIAWRMVGTSNLTAPDSTEVVVLKERVAELEGKERNRIEREAQREVLQMIVDSKEGQPDFVEKYSNLKTALAQTNSNLDAQVSLSDQLKLEQAATANELAEKARINDRLSNQLQAAHQELQASRAQTEKLQALGKKDGSIPQTDEKAEKEFELPLWAAIASGLGVLGFGAGGGYLFGKSSQQLEHTEDSEAKPVRN